ncbi:10181_t:CDS:2, partial [Diversispora eburnea]
MNYTDDLSEIIKRDFFPSLLTLEARHDYVNSWSTNNPDLIIQATQKLNEYVDAWSSNNSDLIIQVTQKLNDLANNTLTSLSVPVTTTTTADTINRTTITRDEWDIPDSTSDSNLFKIPASKKYNANLPEILENSVKPIFLKHSKIHTEKREGKTFSKRILNYGENDLWRGEISHAGSEIESTIGLIIPPILSLIDDYDIRFKTQGVIILNHLLKKVKKSEIIQRSGLSDVFYDALLNCLSYQQEITHVSLLQSSYSAIIELISTVDSMESESRYLKYEKILSQHIIKGFIYAGDKLVIKQVLLDQVIPLVSELGIVVVKYLKDLINYLCSTLEIPLIVSNRDEILNLHLTASKGIEKLIIKCWPRIPQYEGVILKSIATSWYNINDISQFKQSEWKDNNIDNIDNIETLKKTLRKLYQLLKSVCVNINNSKILE